LSAPYFLAALPSGSLSSLKFSSCFFANAAWLATSSMLTP